MPINVIVAKDNFADGITIEHFVIGCPIGFIIRWGTSLVKFLLNDIDIPNMQSNQVVQLFNGAIDCEGNVFSLQL
jgi:hypothetical protein